MAARGTGISSREQARKERREEEERRGMRLISIIRTQVVELDTYEEIRTYPLRGESHCVEFSPDGRRLVFLAGDRGPLVIQEVKNLPSRPSFPDTPLFTPAPVLPPLSSLLIRTISSPCTGIWRSSAIGGDGNSCGHHNRYSTHLLNLHQ